MTAVALCCVMRCKLPRAVTHGPRLGRAGGGHRLQIGKRAHRCSSSTHSETGLERSFKRLYLLIKWGVNRVSFLILVHGVEGVSTRHAVCVAVAQSGRWSEQGAAALEVLPSVGDLCMRS